MLGEHRNPSSTSSSSSFSSQGDPACSAPHTNRIIPCLQITLNLGGFVCLGQQILHKSPSRKISGIIPGYLISHRTGAVGWCNFTELNWGYWSRYIPNYLLAEPGSSILGRRKQLPGTENKHRGKIASLVKCVFKMLIAHTETPEKNVFIIVINSNRNKTSSNSMQGLMHFPNKRIY